MSVLQLHSDNLLKLFMFIYLEVILIFSLWFRLTPLTSGEELSCPNMMSAPDRNYDEGNRELLEVVVALQEWRHWLEGTQQPFMIWKDHKNILYLRSARCLNSRQACWFLYLSCFNYTLSYQFCSQNSSLKSYLRFTPRIVILRH